MHPPTRRRFHQKRDGHSTRYLVQKMTGRILLANGRNSQSPAQHPPPPKAAAIRTPSKQRIVAKMQRLRALSQALRELR